MAALDIYAKQGQWEKCLEVAAKQVSACVSLRDTPGLLEPYGGWAARRATAGGGAPHH